MPELRPAHPRELLAAWHGELPAAEAAVVQQHLSSCAECRTEQESLKRADDQLAQALRPAPVAAFPDRVLARARVSVIAPPRVSPASRWLTAAAALVLLTAAGFGIYRFATKPPAPPPNVVSRYMLIFVQDVEAMRARPPDVRKKYSEEVIAWFERMRNEGRFVSSSRLIDEPGQIVEPGGDVHPGPPLSAGRTATGYLIIRARDDAEAAQIAQSCPIARIDSIVIRKIR